MTIKAAVWEAGRLLVLEERPSEGPHHFDLPGGRVEPGESIDDCLARELEEELGTGIRRRSPLPVKVWSTSTPEGVGVVALAYAVELEGSALENAGTDPQIVAAHWTTAEAYATTFAFVHHAFIEELLEERAGADAFS